MYDQGQSVNKGTSMFLSQRNSVCRACLGDRRLPAKETEESSEKKRDARILWMLECLPEREQGSGLLLVLFESPHHPEIPADIRKTSNAEVVAIAIDGGGLQIRVVERERLFAKSNTGT